MEPPGGENMPESSISQVSTIRGRLRRHTRNWEPIRAVALNPERDAVVNKDDPRGEGKRVSAA